MYALGEYGKSYTSEVHRTNLSSTENIISKLKEVDDGRYDSLIITRGGGSGLEIFDKIEVLEAFSNVK
ncbi:hypothetical protein [Clostridium sp.]